MECKNEEAAGRPTFSGHGEFTRTGKLLDAPIFPLPALGNRASGFLVSHDFHSGIFTCGGPMDDVSCSTCRLR
eukprot:6529853-Prorocentrum_lima.AAC.1